MPQGCWLGWTLDVEPGVSSHAKVRLVEVMLVFWQILKVMLAQLWLIPVCLVVLFGVAVFNHIQDRRGPLASDRKQVSTAPTPLPPSVP